MNIAPNEVFTRTFKKSIRGYSVEEVEDFLQELGEDYEKTYKENLSLKEKEIQLKEQLAKYTNLEKTLTDTLLLAQSAAEQAKLSAQKETELVIQNAKIKANEIINEAQNQALDIARRTDLAKHEYEVYKSRIRAMIESQVKIMDNIEGVSE